MDKQGADIAIEVARIQEDTMWMTEGISGEGSSELGITIEERKTKVLQFRQSFREALISFTVKSGLSIKQLGMKAIHLCQDKIKNTKGKNARDVILENELTHAFYEEYMKIFGTFVGNLSKDLLEANQDNIILLKKVLREEINRGEEFFIGVKSQATSIEYQEQLGQLVGRIEEIYKKVLVNYRREFLQETRSILVEGFHVAGMGVEKTKELVDIIITRVRTPKPQLKLDSVKEQPL